MKVIEMYEDKNYIAPIYVVKIEDDRFAKVTFTETPLNDAVVVSQAYVIPRSDGCYVYDSNNQSVIGYHCVPSEVIKAVYNYMRGI